MRREPSATGLQPLTEIPPRETWNYVVAAYPTHFRPDWPWKEFFPRWRSVTRMITVGGVKRAAHFVATEQEKYRLTSQGAWEDVTEQWLAEQEQPDTPVEPEPVEEVTEETPAPADAWTWERIVALDWGPIRKLVKSLGGDATGSKGDVRNELARLKNVPPPALVA